MLFIAELTKGTNYKYHKKYSIFSLVDLIAMPQVKVTLEGKAISFIDNHQKYGYSSRTELVRDAITRLQQELEKKELEESARIYQEIYDENAELQKLTDGAATESLE